MTTTEYTSDHELKKDTSRASYGVGACCEEFGENWSRYNGTALYMDLYFQSSLGIEMAQMLDIFTET